MSENWSDSWFQSLEMLTNFDNLSPDIPDQVVDPILSDKQREVWRGILKRPNLVWGFNAVRDQGERSF